MSIAAKDIENQVSEAVLPRQTQARTQILIVTQSWDLAEKLSAQMASDVQVQGRTVSGTLRTCIDGGVENWNEIDFLVFEISEDSAEDLTALHRLGRTYGTSLQCVAVSRVNVTDAAREAFTDAGVAELLVIADAAASTVAPAPQGQERAAPLVDAAPAAESEIEPTAADDPEAQPVRLAEVAGDITVVLRARGGAGATTVAVNTAIDLAARGAPGKTALVDLDLQNGTVGLALDLPDSAAMTDFVKGNAAGDADFVERAMQRHACGVDVLTAPDVFAPLTAITPDQIAGLLLALGQRYDHVVVDMPQAVIDWVEPVLESAARVLVVTDMSVPSVKRTRRLIDLITEDHMTLPIQTIVNFEKRPRFSSPTHKEAARLIGRPLDHWIPDEARAARRATDMGVPLQIGAKRSAAARAISGLAASIVAPKRKG